MKVKIINQNYIEIEKLYLDIELYSLTPDDLDLEDWGLDDSELEDIKKQILEDRKNFMDKQYKKIHELEKQLEEMKSIPIEHEI